MSKAVSMLFADLIAGSYLWTGVPADVFVTPWTTQQAKRDKAKTWEYRCRITVERLAATQAQLQDLDLAAQKRRELKENPVGRGTGMIHRADKYLAQQHGREPPQALAWDLPCLCSQIELLCRMTIIQHGSLWNLNMTLRRPTPKSPKVTPKRMMPQ